MTDHDDHGELRHLFDRALAASADEREAVLDRECGGDADLKQRVTAMVAAAEDDRFLGGATADVAPADGAGGAEGPASHRGLLAPGDRVGHFTIRQVLGEGGFGVVYQAEQTEPVRRMVALKVIKPGMDSTAVIARFEAERQALALMDHPCVAKVLDGGVTESGLPYFAMELVKGLPITEHCDRNKLSLVERLQLFIRVCAAVQHAHGKGVIHRDLKPSNILVSYADNTHTPKVIDFGVAKALSQRLTEATIFTEQGQMIGTPEYMSPEQAEMGAEDIDTRSDIYSLGVILYELLTGQRPFDAQTLREAGLAEIQRIIREVEPPRPSTRLSALASGGEDPEDGTRITEARRSELRSLTGTLRRDLDWVVMRCLEKDRERRYDTANALSMELKRYLNDEPVLAGPPTVRYRIGKFVKRNRAGVLAASFGLVLLLAGLAGTSYGLIEARRQSTLALLAAESEAAQRKAAEAARNEAIDAESAAQQAAEAEKAAHRRAERESDRAQQITAYLTEMLGLADPKVALSPDVSIRAMLDMAARRVGDAFPGQPQSEAGVRATIGKAYASIGQLGRAEEQLRRALVLLDRDSSSDPIDVYDALNTLSWVIFDAHKHGSLGPAEYERVTRLRAQIVAASHPTLGRLVGALGEAAYLEGERPDELELVNDLIERARQELTAGHPLQLIVADHLADAGMSLRSTAAAEACFREAARIRQRELPAAHPDSVRPMLSLFQRIKDDPDRNQEAEQIVREMISRTRTVLGDHWLAGMAESELGVLLAEDDMRQDEAETLLRRGAETLVARRGDADRLALEAVGKLAFFYKTTERHEEYGHWAERAGMMSLRCSRVARWAELKRFMANELADLTTMMQRIDDLFSLAGEGLPLQERQREVDEAVDAMIATRRRLVPDDQPLAAQLARIMGFWSDIADNRGVAAGPTRQKLALEALAILEQWEEVAPSALPHVLWQVNHSVDLVNEDYTAAEAAARKALRISEAEFGETEWTTLISQSMLGTTLWRMERYDEAEQLFLDTLEPLAGLEGERWNVLHLLDQLVRLYLDWGRPDSARQHLLRLARADGASPIPNSIVTVVLRPSMPQTAEYLARLEALSARAAGDEAAMAELAAIVEEIVNLVEETPDPAPAEMLLVGEGCASLEAMLPPGKLRVDLTRAALEAFRRQLPDSHSKVRGGFALLAFSLNQAEEFDEAERIARQGLALSRQHAALDDHDLSNRDRDLMRWRVGAHEQSARLLAQNLGRALVGQGKYDEALPHAQAAYEDVLQAEGDLSMNTYSAFQTLATLHARTSHSDELEVLTMTALERLQRGGYETGVVVGYVLPLLQLERIDLAVRDRFVEEIARAARADTFFTRAILPGGYSPCPEWAPALLAQQFPELGAPLEQLADAISRLGRAHGPDREALNQHIVELAATVRAHAMRDLPDHDPRAVLYADVLNRLGHTFFNSGGARGDWVPMDEATVRIYREQIPAESAKLRWGLVYLAGSLLADEQYSAAESIARELVGLAERHEPSESSISGLAAMRLAKALSVQGRFAEAEAPARRACEILFGRPTEAPGNVQSAWEALIEVYVRLGDSQRFTDLGLHCLDTVRSSGRTIGSVNELAWVVVRHRGFAREVYESAAGLFDGREAELEAEVLNTLGVAQYRAGRDRAAIETLLRADKLNRDGGGTSYAGDWMVIAMAHHRLDEHDRAEQAMGRARELYGVRTDWDEDTRRFLEEAETLLRRPAAGP